MQCLPQRMQTSEFGGWNSGGAAASNGTFGRSRAGLSWTEFMIQTLLKSFNYSSDRIRLEAWGGDVGWTGRSYHKTSTSAAHSERERNTWFSHPSLARAGCGISHQVVQQTAHLVQRMKAENIPLHLTHLTVLLASSCFFSHVPTYSLDLLSHSMSTSMSFLTSPCTYSLTVRMKLPASPCWAGWPYPFLLRGPQRGQKKSMEVGGKEGKKEGKSTENN